MANASLMFLKDSTVGQIKKCIYFVCESMKKCELGNGKKMIKYLELLVNQILILTIILAWGAQLSENDFNDSPF